MTRLRGDVLRGAPHRDAALELWRQGRSAPAIAAMLGLTTATVQNYVRCARKANPDAIPRRQPRPLTAGQCAKIRLLKAEGRSYSAIARALNVSITSVCKVLQKAAMGDAAKDPRPIIRAIESEIVEMWKAGHTGTAIADSFGLARVNSVYEIVYRLAPELRRQRWARGQRMLQQVAALRQQKRSYREIACELGITRNMVMHCVRRGMASGVIARSVPDASDAQKHEIITLNATGIFGREIARRLNVKKDTVYRVLRNAGVEPSFTAQRRQLKPKIRTLWEAGWKSDDIADACGVTADQVRTVAHQAAMENPAFRRHAPPLSAVEMERIAALRREGCYSSAEIAELMDVDYSAVKRAIRKLARSEPGLLLDRRLIPKDRLPEVLLLMAQGLPPAAIAERFGVNRVSMTQLLFKLRRRAKTRGRVVLPGIEVQLLSEH